MALRTAHLSTVSKTPPAVPPPPGFLPQTAPPPALSVRGLHMRYGDSPWVIEDLNLDVAPGDILCVLGPSGCGKSTLLRLICGFENPAWGDIRRGEQILSLPRYVLPPEKRGIGMLFQDLAVFPHLTVLENVRFGLEPAFWKNLWKRLLGQRLLGQRADSDPAVSAQLEALLRLTGLQGLSGRYAHELSGGQLQRVALARALAPRPWLLLLDEPFSELDAGLRARIRGEVRAVLKKLGTTSILVTHDQEEAANMADHIAVLNNGRFE